MARRLQFSFGFHPVVEIPAVAAATLEIPMVRPNTDVVFRDLGYRWLSAIRTV